MRCASFDGFAPSNRSLRATGACSTAWRARGPRRPDRPEARERITRNGRPCAVLMPVTEDTDLEAVALATSKRFWAMYDRARARADREGWTPLDAVAKRPRASR